MTAAAATAKDESVTSTIAESVRRFPEPPDAEKHADGEAHAPQDRLRARPCRPHEA